MTVRLILLITVVALLKIPATVPSPVSGKKICIDPGHGGTALTDSYRVGALGEREEWINLRVALMLKKMLEANGAQVLMTRSKDDRVELEKRAELATSGEADLFVSIHHNATADRNVNFPIVYFHGAASENDASVQAAKFLALELKKQLFNGKGHVSVVSDYTIFPKKGAAVLRHSYGIPGLLAEASFFTNIDEEKRLKEDGYNEREATAFMNAIELFFSHPQSKIKEKVIPDQLPVFHVLEEADRMKPEALNWLNDFESGKELFKEKDTASIQKAYELFTRSARSFPDSWVARECHEYRSAILLQQKKVEESKEERIRAKEFYIRE
ncbi:MAG: N-acetylmuramoyl-L-alanine amidase [Chitinophagaceae bacterium]|nr:N-acetylmuramoyl-L-alanine amidase [Chitinophagaceae bacterium]